MRPAIAEVSYQGTDQPTEAIGSEQLVQSAGLGRWTGERLGSARRISLYRWQSPPAAGPSGRRALLTAVTLCYPVPSRWRIAGPDSAPSPQPSG